MKIIVTICFALLTTCAQASGFANDLEGRVYVNLGGQVGYTFGKGFFYGSQASLNRAMDDSASQVLGGAAGVRRYKGETNFYLDSQLSAAGILGMGLGVNFIMPDSGAVQFSGVRLKGWGGLIGHVTLDAHIPVTGPVAPDISLGAFASLPVFSSSMFE